MEPEVTLLPARLVTLLPRGFWATRGMIADCRRRGDCGGRRDGIESMSTGAVGRSQSEFKHHLAASGCSDLLSEERVWAAGGVLT